MPPKEEKIIDLKPNEQGVYEPAGTFVPRPKQQKPAPRPKQKHPNIPAMMHKAKIMTKVVPSQYQHQANEFVQGLEAGFNVLDMLFKGFK